MDKIPILAEFSSASFEHRLKILDEAHKKRLNVFRAFNTIRWFMYGKKHFKDDITSTNFDLWWVNLDNMIINKSFLSNQNYE